MSTTDPTRVGKTSAQRKIYRSDPWAEVSGHRSAWPWRSDDDVAGDDDAILAAAAICGSGALLLMQELEG